MRKSIFVDAPQAHAFEVFTSGIGRWWPKTHKIGGSDLDRPVIEPRAGGRWYQLGADGSECEIGKVPEWDPPARLLLVMAARLPTGPSIRIWSPRSRSSFTPEGSGTRVDLEHRYLERLGDTRRRMREAIDSPGGWSGFCSRLYAEETAK